MQHGVGYKLGKLEPIYLRHVIIHYLKGALHFSQTGVDFPDKSGSSLLLPVVPVEYVENVVIKHVTSFIPGQVGRDVDEAKLSLLVPEEN